MRRSRKPLGCFGVSEAEQCEDQAIWQQSLHSNVEPRQLQAGEDVTACERWMDQSPVDARVSGLQ